MHRFRSIALARTSTLALATCTVLLLVAPTAQAQHQVVEPDNYANGTDISTAVPGITLTTVETGFTDAIVTSPLVTSSLAYPGGASTGTQVFGNNSGQTGYYFPNPTPAYYPTPAVVFRADFTGTTDSVSLDFINNSFGFGTDVGRLEAFDASGHLISDLTTGNLVNEGDFQTLTATSSFHDISYILAAGDDNTAVNLDRLVVGSVPVPVPEASTTVSFGLLLALGLGGVVAARKKAAAVT
ncbi:MAG: hypothetical protein ACRYFS_15465 [Janthinobacterium lividum]